MMSNEKTKGKRKSLELSALPRLAVPSTTSVNRISNQPHALTVDFQYVNDDAVSPCSELCPSPRCSVVSLSPSLFPLPPGASPPPPPASNCSTPVQDTPPPRTSRSQRSASSSWFSPPSPPPTTPLPPTPCQRKLASLIAATNGFESVQMPENVKIKTPSLSGANDPISTCPLITPMTPPRPRRGTYTIDTKGIRESAVDPDAPLSPPAPSLPPPYSPGMCTPERYSNASVPSTRVDSTTPLVYHPTEPLSSIHSPMTESERRKNDDDDDDVEAGKTPRFWQKRPWSTQPKRRKRKIMTVIGAASAALLLVIVGVAVGVYVAVSGGTTAL
ncbi:hypothetical protein F4804DRAFT_18063 [Jackrogersella minutella]|nr:hypothetical protein F4804DRAFT_18063 [Jackrogersella minutella]